MLGKKGPGGVDLASLFLLVRLTRPFTARSAAPRTRFSCSPSEGASTGFPSSASTCIVVGVGGGASVWTCMDTVVYFTHRMTVSP